MLRVFVINEAKWGEQIEYSKSYRPIWAQFREFSARGYIYFPHTIFHRRYTSFFVYDYIAHLNTCDCNSGKVRRFFIRGFQQRLLVCLIELNRKVDRLTTIEHIMLQHEQEIKQDRYLWSFDNTLQLQYAIKVMNTEVKRWRIPYKRQQCLPDISIKVHPRTCRQIYFLSSVT